jgi:integrase
MPYRDVPAFVARLRACESVSALALEFTILTAGRTGEVLGAVWQEMDLDEKVWTVPASRMKAGREHRVPLTARVLNILETVKKVRTGEHVFPGQRRGKPLRGMALVTVLRRLGFRDATVHGFRSAFRDWAGNETSFAREIAEAALAHTVGDMTERAYRRGDALEKRRELMTAWGSFIEPRAASNVVSLRPAR